MYSCGTSVTALAGPSPEDRISTRLDRSLRPTWDRTSDDHSPAATAARAALAGAGVDGTPWWRSHAWSLDRSASHPGPAAPRRWPDAGVVQIRPCLDRIGSGNCGDTGRRKPWPSCLRRGPRARESWDTAVMDSASTVVARTGPAIRAIL